jgi:hypothetical protein
MPPGELTSLGSRSSLHKHDHVEHSEAVMPSLRADWPALPDPSDGQRHQHNSPEVSEAGAQPTPGVSQSTGDSLDADRVTGP